MVSARASPGEWPGHARGRSGERSSVGALAALREVEGQGAVRRADLDLAALGERAEQDRLGDLVLDLGLDHARERPRAEERIEAALGEQAACGVGEADAHA